MPIEPDFIIIVSDRHYDDDTLIHLLQRVKAVGGAMTINLPISAEGRVPESSIAQMQRLGRSLH